MSSPNQPKCFACRNTATTSVSKGDEHIPVCNRKVCRSMVRIVVNRKKPIVSLDRLDSILEARHTS